MKPRHRPASTRNRAHTTTRPAAQAAGGDDGNAQQVSPAAEPDAAAQQRYAQKQDAASLFLDVEERELRATEDSRHAWRAWQLAREYKLDIPEAVLRHLDQIAARELAKRPSRHHAAVERLRDALERMRERVIAHEDRVYTHAVAQRYGVDLPLSRRDQPNLTAIAKIVAAETGVSKNRLLEAYRAHMKAVEAAKSGPPKP